jgi:hypothetical protein
MMEERNQTCAKQNTESSDNQKPCRRCGYKHDKDAWPAKGKTRDLCKKPNHFKKMCRSRNVHLVDDEYSSDEGEEYYAGSIQMEPSVNTVDQEELEWTQTIIVNDKPVNFQLDTGAMCNVMPYSILKAIEVHKKLRTRNTLKSYSGHKIISKGTITLKCRVNELTF